MIKVKMKKFSALAIAAIMAASITPCLADPGFAAEDNGNDEIVAESVEGDETEATEAEETMPAEEEEQVIEEENDAVVEEVPQAEPEEEQNVIQAKGNALQAKAAGTLTNIKLNSSYTGTLPSSGSREFYFTTTSNDSYYEITVINHSINAYVTATLYNSRKSALATRHYTNLNQTQTFDYTFDGKKLEKNSQYYIKIYSYGSTSGKYTILVNEKKDDMGDSYAQAKTIVPGTYKGKIEVEYDQDWMKFVAPADGKYRVKLINQDIGYSLEYQMYDRYAASMGGNYCGITVDKNSSTGGDYTLKKGQIMYISLTSGYCKGNYVFSITKLKKANPMAVSVKTKKVKKSKVKKSARTVKAISVSKAQGVVKYTKVSGSSKLSVNSKTGKITIKKKTKKGKYKIKVKVLAAGNAVYYAKAKEVTVIVKVK